MVKNLPAIQETSVWPLSREDPLEKGMATHSSILALRIPWTDEPDGLQSMGSQGVGHNWATNTLTFTQSFSLFLNGSYSMYSCLWLLSFVLMSVIVIQVSVYLSHLFFFVAVYYSVVWIHHPWCCQCWLVWTVLLWIFLYTYFGEHMHWFLLGMYSGVELLGHKVGVCLILVAIVKLFSKAVVSNYIPTNYIYNLFCLLRYIWHKTLCKFKVYDI